MQLVPAAIRCALLALKIHLCEILFLWSSCWRGAKINNWSALLFYLYFYVASWLRNQYILIYTDTSSPGKIKLHENPSLCVLLIISILMLTLVGEGLVYFSRGRTGLSYFCAGQAYFWAGLAYFWTGQAYFWTGLAYFCAALADFRRSLAHF